jgi:hypothetical protein
LGQDIEASANHRNVLQPSLESYSSLVSRNVSKTSLVTKICRQSTKLLQLSKKLCAPRRNQQGIEKFLKVHRVPGLPFKDSFEPKPGYWGGRCHSCPKATQNFQPPSWSCGVISSNGDVMLPHFFEMGQRWSTPGRQSFTP